MLHATCSSSDALDLVRCHTKYILDLKDLLTFLKDSYQLVLPPRHLEHLLIQTEYLLHATRSSSDAFDLVRCHTKYTLDLKDLLTFLKD